MNRNIYGVILVATIMIAMFGIAWENYLTHLQKMAEIEKCPNTALERKK
jgi:hypothetical protein